VEPVSTTVTTPIGTTYDGFTVDPKNIVVISIIRAGDSMLDAFMRIAPEAGVGKILIQRDEETSLPVLFYSKVPDLKGKYVVVLDPMLATGGSAKVAIDVCLKFGADISKTLFVNVVASPQGISLLQNSFPDLSIITTSIDAGLNAKVGVTFVQL
jgi:uracil phosphoribosyltransferase